MPIPLTDRALDGANVVTGHAPEFLTPGRRCLNWFSNLSDIRLSLYMLALALAIAAALFVVDWRLFD